MAEKIRKPTKQQNLINNFVTVEFSVDKYFWGRETKIASGLFKKYPEDFLIWLRPPFGYKKSSLVFLLTKEGKDYLAEQYVDFKNTTTDLTPKFEVIPLSDAKIGDDVTIERKPRTLQEFLQVK